MHKKEKIYITPTNIKTATAPSATYLPCCHYNNGGSYDAVVRDDQHLQEEEVVQEGEELALPQLMRKQFPHHRDLYTYLVVTVFERIAHIVHPQVRNTVQVVSVDRGTFLHRQDDAEEVDHLSYVAT